MIIIASTFTAEPMQYTLNFLLRKFTDETCQFIYNQIFQQLLQVNSELYRNSRGLNVLLIRFSDWKQKENNWVDDFHKKIEEFLQALMNAESLFKVPVFVIVTPSHANNHSEEMVYVAAERTIRTTLESSNRYSLITWLDVQKNYPVDDIFNDFTEERAHIPYKMEFYTALSAFLARQYYLLNAKPFKVIVLDCDGTLWNGIIEEDGINGIKVTAREKYIQEFMLRQYQQGMLLCLCSKNTENSVLTVFKEHPEMILNLDHITSHRINWQRKSENIKSLASELNLGLDSFIFVDDNPAECAEVKSECPAVLTIALPKKLNQLRKVFENIWAFDHLKISQEDTQRTILYKQNAQRNQWLAKAFSYTEFLEKLNLNVIIRLASESEFSRICQLAVRTNQFNLNPGKIDEENILKKIKNQDGCLVVHATDKFGDYGLIGVILYKESGSELVVDKFLLSCRALGKGIEHRMLNKLATIAREKSLSHIKVLFSKTEKNEPALKFLNEISPSASPQELGYVLLSISEAEQVKIQPLKNSEPALIARKEINNLGSSHNHSFLLSIAKTCQTVPGILSQLRKKNKALNQFIQSDFPENRLQIEILEILQEYDLNITDLNHPLIEYGINSLKAVLISSDLYQKYQVEINYIDLISLPFTLKKLIDSISEKITTANVQKNDDISVDSVDPHFLPLSFPQQRLWLDEQLDPGTAKNNMSISLEISGNVDIKILTRCFITLIERHDSLRSAFFNENGEPYLKIKSVDELDFHIDFEAPTDTKELANKISELSQLPFNLSQAPLLRVVLFKIEPEKNILLICIHHIIHDGWSLNIFLKELGILYDSYQNKLPNPLPEITFGYKDFIKWQQDKFPKEILNNQKDFWEASFKELSHLNLPYDTPRSQENPQSQRLGFKLNKHLYKQLSRLAKNNKFTLYDVLLSAFNIFLSQYTNQTEINLITAVSGRHYPKVNSLVGFFVNLLILHTTIEKQDKFKDILDRNKQFFSNAFLNQELPYNPVISKIDAAFIYQNYEIHPLIINGAEAKRVYSDNVGLLYDNRKKCRFGNLVLFAQECDGEIHCLFEYNSSLFFPKTVRQMIISFKTLLKNLVANSDQGALSIPLIDSTSKNIVLNQFNQIPVDYSQSANIITFFKESVNINPNKPAIKYQESQLTYLELDKISNQLAHYLIKNGVAHETPVGIYLQKGINYIVAMLSIIKAGGCYVPIDPEFPESRVRHIIRDTGINIIISEEKSTYLDKLPPENMFFVFMDQKKFSQEKTEDCDYSNISPSHLAYIMYTSGSTGEPKGVMIEQKGIMRLIKKTNYIHIGHEDRVAQTANLAFDGATFEIWGALLNGATLFVISNEVMSNIQEFGSLLDQEKISILFLTTQLFHVYAYQQPSIFSHLRSLVVGGEAVLAEAINAVMKMPLRPQYFINGYGPTENTTFSSVYVITDNQPLANPISIGKPITGTQIYILNDHLNLKPIGALGRLFVGGLGVARGYLNQEELNQTKFIRNPFNPTSILYDTGDIAAWQPDGNIKFLGRSDNQIKLHGYRIELNEIELALKSHPDIEQAVVLAEGGHEKKLVAYVLVRGSVPLSRMDLPKYLKVKLPKYMIPSLYYSVDKFPITQMGKIDRSSLSKTPRTSQQYDIHEEPHDKIQRELLKIYSTILNLDKKTISINSDFFDLGGDSLSAIRLINDLHVKYLVKINLSSLYECPTVKLLSNQVRYLLDQKNQKLHSSHLNACEEFTLKLVKLGDITKPPIIFIHPIGGTGFCYLDLIRCLPSDQACYIIQDPSIEADQILFGSIPEMATYYNQVILKKFKKGQRVILAGFSFGGMLCLEMVQGLEQAQKDNIVELVIFFDTWVMSDVLNAQAKEAIKSSMLHQYDKIMANLLAQNIEPKSWMELNYNRLQHLGFSYSPGKINKRIVLFKAEELSANFSAMQEPTNYLRFHTTRPVEVYMAPGNHETILQNPNVKQVATFLTSVLGGIAAIGAVA